MKLTARYPFSASHRLHSEQLSEASNWTVYGKCNNPFGHGHNYWLEVTVQGEADRTTGMIVKREKLDHMVEEEVLKRVSHRNLSVELSELNEVVPTTENVAMVFLQMLQRGWGRHFKDQSIELSRVRIYETRNNRFEINAHEVKQ